MTPMPINTGDGELLSRSNVLLKILSLSNFPFYILQCTQAFTADCTNFQRLPFWSKMPKKIFLFSAAGYLEGGYYKKKKKRNPTFVECIHGLQVKPVMGWLPFLEQPTARLCHLIVNEPQRTIGQYLSRLDWTVVRWQLNKQALKFNHYHFFRLFQAGYNKAALSRHRYSSFAGHTALTRCWSGKIKLLVLFKYFIQILRYAQHFLF